MSPWPIDYQAKKVLPLARLSFLWAGGGKFYIADPPAYITLFLLPQVKEALFYSSPCF